MLRFSALAAALLLAPPALAQGPKACTDLHPQLEFCTSGQSWQKDDRTVPEALGFFRMEGGGFGKVILEEVPGQAQIDPDLVQETIIAMVSRQIESAGGSVEVSSKQGGEIGGDLAGTIIYRFTRAGQDVLTMHSYLVSRNLVMQFITSTQQENRSAQDMHRSFLVSFKVQEPEILL